MIPIQVDSGILLELQEFCKNHQIVINLISFESNRDTWLQDVLNLREQNPYVVMIIRKDWVRYKKFEYPPALIEAVKQGSVRLCFWSHDPTGELSVPHFNLSGEDEKIRACMLRHLTRGLMPGAHNFLPESSLIFSDRIKDLDVMQKKIEQVYLYCDHYHYPIESKTGRIEGALRSSLKHAFDQMNIAKAASPFMHFQLGLSKDVMAISIKWTTPQKDIFSWMKYQFDWQITLNFTDALWFHLIPEKEEAEVVFLYSTTKLSSTIKEHKLPFGADVFTAYRLELIEKYPDANPLQAFQLKPFKEIKSVKTAAEVKEGVEHRILSNLHPANSPEVIAANPESIPPLKETVHGQVGISDEKNRVTGAATNSDLTSIQVKDSGEKDVSDSKQVIQATTQTESEGFARVLGKAFSDVPESLFKICMEKLKALPEWKKLEEISHDMKSYQELKMEFEQQKKQIEWLKDENLKLTKKLSVTLEEEKHSLMLTEIDKNMQAPGLLRELEKSKRIIEHMKEKEMELVKRLNVANETIKKLKLK